MRSYSVATAALALQASAKWLDNLLSQNRVEGVSQIRQGVQRKLSPGALYLIATVHSLNREFQIPVAAALRIAHALWHSPSVGSDDSVALEVEGVILQINRARIRSRVDAALAEALEMAPRTRRGRPRGIGFAHKRRLA